MIIQTKVMARELSEYLWRSERTVATAESCTAGMVSTALAHFPGSSTYFRGGIVAYTDEMKTELLGIDAKLLAEKGAVSEEVARAMVAAAIDRLHTDYAVAVTGYAGPTGGREAPVGTIYVAAGSRDDISVRCLTGDDGREENTVRATSCALQMLCERLQRDFPRSEG